jgi:lysylphosphatidylglycerol synthetase-like protein (DUF2156 family)
MFTPIVWLVIGTVAIVAAVASAFWAGRTAQDDVARRANQWKLSFAKSEERIIRKRLALTFVAAVCLLVAIAALVLAAVTETPEERAARESREFWQEVGGR